METRETGSPVISLSNRLASTNSSSTCSGASRRQSRCAQPCEPMDMPARQSSRTPSLSSLPRSPSSPAGTKNWAVSPRFSSRGRAISTSDAFPSSNVSWTSGRPTAASSTSSNCAILIHATSSPGSSSRTGVPIPCTVMLTTDVARSSRKAPTVRFIRPKHMPGNRQSPPCGRNIGRSGEPTIRPSTGRPGLPTSTGDPSGHSGIYRAPGARCQDSDSVRPCGRAAFVRWPPAGVRLAAGAGRPDRRRAWLA